MRLWPCLLGCALVACSGLYSRVDGGTGADAGPLDAGSTPDAGGVDAGCVLNTDCPQPANSTAACNGGSCSFQCALPYLHCPSSCCTAVAVTAGDIHTCLLTSEGGVKCWGGGATVGDGTTLERLFPVDVVGLSSKALAISAGSSHTCARLDTGAVECWGVGTIGNGTSLPGLRATRVSLVGGPEVLASGGFFGCVLVDGGVKCWGSDSNGQQGTNGGGPRNVPGDVSGLAYDVRQLATGYSHACAALTDGGARCWGNSFAGECGDGVPQVQRRLPVEVTALDAGIVSLYAGFGFSCALTPAGVVKCWGSNGQGQGGSSVVSSRQLVAASVVGITSGLTFLALGPAAAHACAVQDGGAWCWGNGDHGQLGDGNLLPRNSMVQVLGLGGSVSALATGGSHTCALTLAGEVLCWGNNGNGQVGDGTKGGNRLTPQPVR